MECHPKLKSEIKYHYFQFNEEFDASCSSTHKSGALTNRFSMVSLVNIYSSSAYITFLQTYLIFWR